MAQVSEFSGIEFWRRVVNRLSVLLLLLAVVVFVVVDSVDEAVELANASEYSLTAGVWSDNAYAAQHVAMRVRSGVHPPT